VPPPPNLGGGEFRYFCPRVRKTLGTPLLSCRAQAKRRRRLIQRGSEKVDRQARLHKFCNDNAITGDENVPKNRNSFRVLADSIACDVYFI